MYVMHRFLRTALPLLCRVCKVRKCCKPRFNTFLWGGKARESSEGEGNAGRMDSAPGPHMYNTLKALPGKVERQQQQQTRASFIN